MSLPHVLHLLVVLARDTLAQARFAGLTAALAVVTAVCTVFCLGLSVAGDEAPLPTAPWENAEFLPRTEAERLKLSPGQARGEGVDVPTGEMRVLFGAVRVPLTRTRDDAVRLVLLVLAGGVAGTLGLLVCLVWTAGFLPDTLRPSAATVLLAKPAPRWLLVAGKAAGVVTVAALQAALFTALTWAALGLRTGVWEPGYWAAVPILVMHFGVFLGVSALIAVTTRSAAASALGTLSVWVVCLAVNIARHEAAAHAGGAPATLEVAYRLLPKPADYNLALAESLGAADSFGDLLNHRRLRERGELDLAWSVLGGLAACAVLYAIAGWRLGRVDY